MSFTKTVMSTLVVSSIALSAPSSAQNAGVNDFVAAMMSSAISEVKQEIDAQVSKSLLTMSHNLSLDSEPTVALKTSVRIKDLPRVAADVKESKKSADTQRKAPLYTATVQYDEL